MAHLVSGLPGQSHCQSKESNRGRSRQGWFLAAPQAGIDRSQRTAEKNHQPAARRLRRKIDDGKVGETGEDFPRHGVAGYSGFDRKGDSQAGKGWRQKHRVRLGSGTLCLNRLDSITAPSVAEGSNVEADLRECTFVGAGPVGLFLANECARRSLRWGKEETRRGEIPKADAGHRLEAYGCAVDGETDSERHHQYPRNCQALFRM